MHRRCVVELGDFFPGRSRKRKLVAVPGHLACARVLVDTDKCAIRVQHIERVMPVLRTGARVAGSTDILRILQDAEVAWKACSAGFRHIERFEAVEGDLAALGAQECPGPVSLSCEVAFLGLPQPLWRGFKQRPRKYARPFLIPRSERNHDVPIALAEPEGIRLHAVLVEQDSLFSAVPHNLSNVKPIHDIVLQKTRLPAGALVLYNLFSD